MVHADDLLHSLRAVTIVASTLELLGVSLPLLAEADGLVLELLALGVEGALVVGVDGGQGLLLLLLVVLLLAAAGS